MTEPEAPLHSIMPILLRFSAEASAIRRLVAADEAFRCLAEDYLLAFNTLRALRNRTPPCRAAIDEYSAILHDLEKEISVFLKRSRGMRR